MINIQQMAIEYGHQLLLRRLAPLPKVQHTTEKVGAGFYMNIITEDYKGRKRTKLVPNDGVCSYRGTGDPGLGRQQNKPKCGRGKYRRQQLKANNGN